MPEIDDPGAARDGGVGAVTTTSPGPSGAPGGPVPGPQVSAWAGDLSDRVVNGVGWVKARTTLPVVKVLRAIVYGLVVVISLVTALMLAMLGMVRMWDVYIPVHPLARRVWLGYVVLGGALFLAGGALLARRSGARRRR